MPVFRVTAPNGKQFDISTPDGWKRDEVLRELSSRGVFDAPEYQPNPALERLNKKPITGNLTQLAADDNVERITPAYDGYLTAKAKSGVKMVGAVAAGLVNDLFGVSESDLAATYKNDPAGLARAKASPGYWFGRQAEALSKDAAFSAQNITPEDKAAYDSREYFTTDASKSAFMAPKKIAGDLIQNAPTSAAMALTAFLTRGAGASAERNALAAGMSAAEARNIGIRAAQKTFARVGALSEGSVGYEQQKQQVRDEVAAMPDEMFAKSPIYQQLLRAGYAPATAKIKIAADLGHQAGLDAGFIDAATNAVGGHYLGKVIGEGGKLIPRVAKGFANESITEAVQSGGEQVAQNDAERTVDPRIKLTDKVGESIVQGSVIGSLMGGGTAGLAGHHSNDNVPSPAPSTPGVQETAAASAAAAVTPQDHASPIPTDMIAQGKAMLAAAAAKPAADAILGQHGLPGTGSRVQVHMPDGSTRTGTMADAFVTEAPGMGSASGVNIQMDDGSTLSEHIDTLHDAGVRIAPDGANPAMVTPPKSDPQSITPKPQETAEKAPISTPESSAPSPPLAGERIDGEWTRFHPDTGSIGVPRADMPQIAAEHRGAMVNFLNARGIDHQEETVPADSLKPTQAEFSPQKVQKAKDYKGGNRAILISSDNHVLDGHHQWSAAHENGEDVRAIRLNAPIHDLLTQAADFPSASTVPGATASVQRADALTPAERAEYEALKADNAKGDLDGEDMSRYLDLAKQARQGVVDAAQAEVPAQPSSKAEQLPSPTIEDTASGKGIMVKGASAEQLAAIKATLPEKVTPVENKKLGGWVWSKKHEAAIRKVLAGGVEKEAEHPGLVVKSLRTGKETIVQPIGTVPPKAKLANGMDVADAAKVAREQSTKAAEQHGASSFAGGRERILPDHLQQAEPDAKSAWYRGWDKANLAAPLPSDQEAKPQESADPAAKPAPESKADQKAYGSANKVFTLDAAEKARALLRSKLNQINSAGFDPEVAQAGLTLMGYHMEAGARAFMDAARAVSQDLGMSPADLKGHLRAWYTSARNWFEDNGHDVRGMDEDAAVKVDLSRIDQWGKGADKTDEATQPSADDLPGLFRDKLLAGDAFRSITEARKVVEQATGEKVESGTARAKEVDEVIEAGVVLAAREIVAKGLSPADTYAALVDLYKRQPSLNVRTSTSIEQQAYSTPVPLAFLASHLAGIARSSKVYEPSAGNGALLLSAKPENVTANELNPDRASKLRAILPGAKITENDATEFAPSGKFDVVIANPPFGPIKDESGQNRVFDMGSGYETREIDHAIALKALESMKDDGGAVLIVGSINKTITRDDARSDAYNAKAKREFYLRLYSQYNVTDHFTVAGELYSRQGAGWPVDVIVIDGRGKSALRVPAADVPRQYSSWEQLKDTLDGRPETDAAIRDAAGSAVERGERSARSDDGNGAGSRGRGAKPGRGQDGDGQSVRARSDNGQSPSPRLVQSESGNNVAPTQGAEHRGTDRPAPVAKVTQAAGENALQVAYSPASGKASLGTLVPVNMQTAARQALDNLQSQVGAVDDYVAEKLGYDPAKLGSALSAEQVDAVALAISNMERGAGFIIGDQTGIGKGRVVASIIRYALREKRRPIFVTEKPNLYADMYRDMNDIGVPEMLGRPVNILMTNAAETVPLDDEGKQVLKTPAAAKHNQHLMDVARGGGDYDVVFTTYSQMQALKGEMTERQTVLKAMAPGSILIFDESHNAGGQGAAKKKSDKATAPNRAEFARELAGLAHGVFFSSATYAKRPDVMDLYSSTDMSLAVPDVKKLGDAIARGGIPMQQVIASNLAEAGQYVRRERSFDGVTYNTPTVPVDRATYSQFTDSLQAIQQFSEKFAATATKGIDRDLKADGKSITGDNSTGGAGAESTNFTAIMHNLIDQMLLAMKAPEAAARAVQAIKDGKKPVITVANTMASFLDDFANDNGIAPGDEVELDFTNLLLRYLERTRIITIKKPFSKEKGERHRLTDAELGPDGVAAFKAARKAIEKIDLSGLPISPIDYIRGEIIKAGYQVGEITGRNATLEYGHNGGPATFRRRPSTENSIAGRRRAISGFNGGTIDAMILNQAGSTGLSLHASKTFKDQKPRHMIIAQAEKNIDTHMQMLGRIHRSGQVVLPSYDQLTADVPAEKRPTAILAKKMASLNANTTGSRDSALSADAPDFLNQYGDILAARMMEEDPDLHERLAEPLKQKEKSEELETVDAARKVTGRIVLLSLPEQEQFYERFLQEYRDFLAQKEASGESALEAKTLSIDAKTIDRQQVVAPSKAGTPFGEGVYLETVDAKRLGKPYSPDQVVGMTAKAMHIEEPDGDSRTRLASLKKSGQDWVRNFASNPLKDFAEYRRNVEDNIEDEKRLADTKQKLDDNVQRFRDILTTAYPGAGVRLQTEMGAMYGVVTKVEKQGKARNPLALSAFRVTVALADSSRTLTIPVSQLTIGAPEFGRVSVQQAESIGQMPLLDAFGSMQREAREKRQILTGNILAAFDHINGKGQIVNFVTDSGDVKPGIMMPRDFDYAKAMAEKPVQFRSTDQVVRWLMSGKPAEAEGLKVVVSGRYVEIDAASSKAVGGKYFLNAQVRAAIDGVFYKRGNIMHAEAPLSRINEVIRALREGSGAVFAATTDLGEARDIVASTGDSAVAQAREAEASKPKASIPEDLPSVSVRESDWGKLPDAGKARITVLRGRVMRWYSGLVGTTIQSSDGRTVGFNDAGLDKTQRAGEQLLMAARSIPKIIQRGKLISSEPANRPGLKSIHKYAAMVRSEEGISRPLLVVVRENAQGSLHYSLHHYQDYASDTPADAGREAKMAFTHAVEGGAEDVFNLFDAGKDFNPGPDGGHPLEEIPADLAERFRALDADRAEMGAAARAERAAYEKAVSELGQRMDDLGLSGRISLAIVDKISRNSNAAGEYWQRLIRVALSSRQGPMDTLNHEAIHALRDLGLIYDGEWAVLSRAAKADKAMMESVRQRYPNLSEEGQIEEAIADRFKKFAANPNTESGLMARAFQRLRGFIEALGNALRRNGFRTADDVMRAIDSGMVGQRTSAETKPVARGPLRSQDQDTFAAEAMTELAQADDLFQSPPSEAKTIAGAMKDVVPDARHIRDLTSDSDVAGTPYDGLVDEMKAQHVSVFETKSGHQFFVMQDGKEVWLDVHKLTPGEGGSRIYQAVADYAYNTGKVFIGDPAGLSDIAMSRRNDAMLSSALKHGTTDHLEPHARQIKGDPRLGYPALRWVKGDTIGNIQSMINASIRPVLRAVPQIENATYDFAKGTFRDAQGAPLSDEALGVWGANARGSGAAGIGVSSLKRAILLKSLAHAESSSRPGLLERIFRQYAQLAGTGGLRDTLYSIPETAFDNEETEKRFQDAKDGVASKETLRERMNDFFSTAWHGISRHWINLPNTPEYADLQQKLRIIEAAPSYAKERTVAMLEDMVKDFTPADLDLFTRKVILDDLVWDAANERELPFGLTEKSLWAEKAKIDQIVMADPDKKVFQAVMKRKLANRAIANELVEAGVLEAEQIKNPAYYRHQVLEYARAEQRRAAVDSGNTSRLRSPKWAKRMGSSLDINANLLEAEFDWLNKAFTDIPVAKTIEWIKQSKHNLLPELQTQARESNKAGIGAKLDEARDILDDHQASPEEQGKAQDLIDTEFGFRRSIAMGFGNIRARLRAGEINVPRQHQKAADAIENDVKGGEPPFAFLSWILDNDEPGAMGAAMVLKAIGQRRAWEKALLGKAYIDPQNAEELAKRLAPDNHTTWQPDQGKLLFTVKTLPEHVIDQMIEKLEAPAGMDIDAFRAALEGARSALAMGGSRYTMILPNDVANTLNQLRRPELEGLYDLLVKAPIRAWKRWVLINPRRIIKYNLNNMTGDLDAVIAGNPRALRRFGEAAKELYEVMAKRAQPSDRYQEAMARGVFDSGLSIQEIPDLHDLAPFERFAKQRGPINKITAPPLRKAWNALQGATQWRENILRYASYLDYVDRIESGEAQASIGYGASVPAMVDSVTDAKDRAALLARDLMGDYGAISHYGAGIRKSVIPFWSWAEINTKRYWRLTMNAGAQGIGKGIATGGTLAISAGVRQSAWLTLRMAMLYGLMSLWNGMLHPDEEKELDEAQRSQMHLILGRNAKGEVITLRTQGAMSDALGWFGLGDTADAIHEYQLGRKGLAEILAAPPKAAINKIGTSLSPIITLPLESATGKKLWPDLFDTRANRDRWRNALSTFSLDNEYDAAMGKPSRGYGRSWEEALIYRRDPGEMAYNQARGIAFDWLQRVKGQDFEGGFQTPRGNALHDYRTALRFGDQSAAERAMEEMARLDMKRSDLAASIKHAAPLGSIAKKDRKAFVDQLTDKEYETFQRAQLWYQDTFIGK